MKEKVIAVLLFIVALLSGTTAYNLGSVESASGAYMATTTTSLQANSAVKVMTGPGILGHIVIGDDPTAGYIRLWDATSTATSTYQGESPSGTYGRLIAQTAVDIAEGTLVLDAEVKYGLVIETQAGFNGIISTTYKR